MFQSFVDRFKENVLKPAIASRMDAAGKAWVAEAVARAPEDTGFLKRSIGHTFNAATWTLNLYADAPYAFAQEFGYTTRAGNHVPGRAFMRGALAAVPRVFRSSAALQFANTPEKYQARTAAHAASKAGGRHKVKVGHGKFA